MSKNGNVTYPAFQVLLGAAVAYCSCVSGYNDSYVTMKSNAFLTRCARFDGLDPNDMDYFTPISKEAVEEIAYAALDADCESVMWNYLAGKENKMLNDVTYELPDDAKQALEAPGHAMNILL